MPTIYILLCSDDTYFTGITSNLKTSLHQHKTGFIRKCYTFNRRPIILCYSRDFPDAENATIRYRQIKKWSQAKKEALIYGYLSALPSLSKKKF